jgi:putative hydrolase of the HAD superfamily
MAGSEIPFAELETIFLDVGNTLVAMDYAWIQRELSARGIEADVGRIHRAEAAARPAVSRAVAGAVSTEGTSVFALYLREILHHLGVSRPARAVVEDLLAVFRGPGRERLWTYVLPGVPEALERLRDLGLGRVVVSNSDGSVERVLAGRGLRELLDAVFDSQIVGLEKPDPRFFQHALRETGASPARTLHVGDLYAADVVGGRAAGLHTALLDPFGDWADADCARFTDLAELARVLAAARGA